MKDWKYTRGLHDLGRGSYAWLQPDGSFGWSNAGLVCGEGGESLLVDTLFDLRLTGEMLDAMAELAAGSPIKTLVNTHANGDHCWGNQLVEGAEIIGSKACREEMLELEPSMLAGLHKAEGLGAGANYLSRAMAPFELEGIKLTPPTRVFEGTLTLEVAGRRVELIEVGPAHTRGDILVHIPADRTIFTGDILFIDGTPIVWAGPVSNWVRACDLMLAMDLETVVPGHGPITDNDGIRAVRSYLVFVEEEARKRFDAGMTVVEACRDIALGRFASWADTERLAVNVDTLYREFRGDSSPPDVLGLIGLMGELRS